MKAQPKKKNHWLKWIFIALAVIVVLAGGFIAYVAYNEADNLKESIKKSQAADELPPCGTSATQVPLGSPYRGSHPVAYFTTDGSDVYISARKFSHGGALDPKTGVTGIWIGDATTPPTYDEQRSIISNTKLNFYVEEGKHKKAQLPAGRYWLWTSPGGDIVAESCGQVKAE